MNSSAVELDPLPKEPGTEDETEDFAGYDTAVQRYNGDDVLTEYDNDATGADREWGPSRRYTRDNLPTRFNDYIPECNRVSRGRSGSME